MHLRSNYATEGGPETLILSFIRRIDSSRFGITIVSLQDIATPESPFLAAARGMGIQAESVLWKGFILCLPTILTLRTLIKKYNIDALHTHDVRSDFAGLIASKMTGIPVVTSIHGWVGKSLKEKVHDFVDNKLIIRFCDRIIVNCEAMRKKVRPLKAMDKRITTIYNAVDFSHINTKVDPEKVRKELGLNSRSQIIVTLGRLSKEKGHRFLLEAARKVVSAFPDVVFLIVGQGPLERELQDFANELQLSHNVVFTGFFQDLSKILGLMDLFVLPSLSEGLPISMLEAMAAGKPVIATNVGGVPEVIDNGETGIVIESKNANKLATAIMTLLEDKKKAKELGRKGQKLIRERFSAEIMVEKLEEIYRCLYNFSMRSVTRDARTGQVKKTKQNTVANSRSMDIVDLDIIIVNYNTKDYLKKCIESIYKNTHKTNFEIIVVDNDSNDGSVRMIEDVFPDVKLIVNQRNLGFAKANNKGLVAGQGRYCLLQNSDTLVLPSSIDIMKEFMDKHSEVGIIGSKTFYPDHTVQGTARSFPTPVNAVFGRKSLLTRLMPNNRFSQQYLTCLAENYTEPFEVDWVAGSCLMIKRKVIEEIGLLDERFWMYWEDADWCYRAKKKGWKICCVPDAQIIHYEGVSSNGQNARLIMEFNKSVYRYYRKHHIKSPWSPMNLFALIVLSIRTSIHLAMYFTKSLLGRLQR